MITIKEIADQLGVSATTVSNVLNGRPEKCHRRPDNVSKKHCSVIIM